MPRNVAPRNIVELIREFHVGFAYLTLASFAIRGLLSIAESPLRNARWMRIAPHVIDTFLLLFGIALAVMLSLSPLANGWRDGDARAHPAVEDRRLHPGDRIGRLHIRGGVFEAGHAVLGSRACFPGVCRR